MPTPDTGLSALLTLERIGTDEFRADPGPPRGRGPGRLFGGLVVAQALLAAAHSVERGAVHSLHAYFLRPGRYGDPLALAVDRIRDGHGFTSRRVVVLQHGEPIAHLAASFQDEDEGVSHQDAMPEAPDPESLTAWGSGREAIEMRPCALPPGAREGGPAPPFRVWLRPRAPLPDDPRLHAAALAYASDGVLLGAFASVHGLPWVRGVAASLDHALWLHRAPRFDDWILYAAESPAAHAGRGLALGAMYGRDGTRLASVAQEGLVRLPGLRSPRTPATG